MGADTNSHSHQAIKIYRKGVYQLRGGKEKRQ